jgi:TPR repeat protein
MRDGECKLTLRQNVDPMSEPDWTAEPDLAGLRRAYDLMSTDHSNAIARLEALASQGSIMSMLYIARSFATGGKSEENSAKAAEWYRKAADKGSLFASYSLAKLYLTMNRAEEARKILESDALRDYMPAIHERGRIYHRG